MTNSAASRLELTGWSAALQAAHQGPRALVPQQTGGCADTHEQQPLAHICQRADPAWISIGCDDEVDQIGRTIPGVPVVKSPGWLAEGRLPPVARTRGWSAKGSAAGT